MEPDEFREHLAARVAVLMEKGGDAYTLLGRTPAGLIPVGVITTEIMEASGIRRQIWPHAIWFPEASARNRVECWIRILLDLKKQGNVMVVAGEANWRFFRHLCKYGVMRPLGKIWGHLDNGKDAMMYQCVNSEMARGVL